AKRVDRLLLAVDKAAEHLDPSLHYIVTGNPVRPEIVETQRGAARRELGIPEGRFCILSFGGSLGAQRINEAIAAVMAWHIPTGEIHHIHATGKYGVELLPRLLTEHGVAWQHNPLLDIREYIDNMPVCLAAADLVICRAGAITLSELQAAGRASILIPSPNVAENHQYHNAMVLVNRDAAEILEEKELTGERLTQMVKRFREDPTLASRLGANAKAMAMTTANSQIAEEILALL
ncbi:MAG: UDP-N-acetylglucosamine--N-acetylmuramyl-(pentapeptide) pyrophosphoryl-undecaprenol N-acetylglucosamine transferase, partial [Angelakisella sp.]